MIFFGHLGLTYAAASAFDKTVTGIKKADSGSFIDYRFVFIGSVLPDLIDKPLIFFIFGNTIHSGRIFAHTLLFVLLLAGAGIIIQKCFNRSWALILAACSLFHLVLDRMWMYMSTLLWPAYDIINLPLQNYRQVVRHAVESIINQKFQDVSILSFLHALEDPFTGISELIGFLIIAYFLIMLVSRKKLVIFLKTGHWQAKQTVTGDEKCKILKNML